VLDRFSQRFSSNWLNLHRAKLGLRGDQADDESDGALINDLLALMHEHRVDFTLGFRRLSALLRGQDAANQALWGVGATAVGAWHLRWQARLETQGEPQAAIADRMDATNPLYIPRNHLVENALDAAVESQDMRPFERLLAIVGSPFDERVEDTLAALPGTPEQTAGFRTFCGT
jgi:serine/tyrosine/threonine adenylyltransferase